MRRLTTLALSVLVLMVSSVSLATTVIQMDLEDLVSESDAIVVGEVDRVASKLHDDGRVYTHVGIAVDETWKGEPADAVEIVHIGGRVDSRATVVHGMPDFTEGERVLLFLEKPDSVKHYVVTGLSQGKISLTEDEEGKLTLEPATGDMALVKPIKLPTGDVKLERAEPADVTTSTKTLDDMRQRVREMLEQPESDDAKTE